MADKIYTCRKCHQTFIAKEEEKEVTWHQRSKGYNYHMSCWESYLKKDSDKNDDEWLDLIFDLITRELHSSYDFFKIKAQADGFVNKGGMSMKGIYFTLYWFFIVRKGEYKEEYGIAIVPHVYDQSASYWLEQENKRHGLMDEIEKIKRIEAAEGRVIRGTPRRRKRKQSEEPTII